MSLIYYIILITIIVSSIIEYSREIKPSKVWFYSVVSLMIFVAGFGYALGPDWMAYLMAYEQMEIVKFSDLPYYSIMTSMEVGYLALNKFVYSLGLGHGAFILFIVTISLILKTTTIYKYGKYVFLGLLLYFVPNYFFEDNIHFRQGLATAIILFSIRYIIERKVYYFLLCIIIAFQFHKSSVVFLPAYWIAFINLSTINLGLLVVFGIMSSMFGLSVYIDSLVSLLPFGIGEKFESHEAGLGATGALAIGDVVKVLTVIAVLLFDELAKEKSENYIVFRNIYIAGVAMFFFFGKGIFGIRLPGYYLIYFCLLVPCLIEAVKEKALTRNILYSMFIIYTISLFIRFYELQGDKTRFGDYSTIFNSEASYGFFR